MTATGATSAGETGVEARDKALAYIERNFGLEFPQFKMREFLFKVELARSECGYNTLDAYYRDIHGGRLTVRQLDVLVRHITVNESYFLRHESQFDNIVQRVIPELVRSLPDDQRPLRAWSAGCARGEEPYSLAIKLESPEAGLLPPADIVGTDLNGELIEQARSGRYNAWSLRDLAPQIREKYFSVDGKNFVLDPRMRSKVRFLRYNLASAVASCPFGIGVKAHLILCRNVLYYMKPEQAGHVLQRFHDFLAPGGFLVLGPSESLDDFDLPFKTVYFGSLTAYRKSEDSRYSSRRAVAIKSDTERRFERLRGAPLNGAGGGTVPVSMPPPVPAPLSPKGPEQRDGRAKGRGSDLVGSIGEALRHKDKGEYEAAIFRLAPFKGNLDADLAAADVYHAMRNHDGLRASCDFLRKKHPGHVAGYYYQAILSQEEGDPAGAAEYFRQALYLDHEFVAGHIGLAEAQKRQGKTGESRRSLRNAASLLVRLDPSTEVPFADGLTAGDLLMLVGGEDGGGEGEA